MCADLIGVESKGPVHIITLKRPDQRNAVNKAAAEQLYQAFKRFQSDSSLRVAVLHGAGGTFCAGYDLKELATSAEDHLEPLGPGLQDNFGGGASPMGPTHIMFSKPVIAAVSGYAVAGGLELALMCDLRVMEEDAIMGVFSRRFGVPLIDGGTVRLPALIGLSRALDLILTGRPVEAKEALEIGLANRVVPPKQSLAAALALAEQLCQFPQQCLRADRNSTLAHAGGGGDMQEALAQEYRSGVRVLHTESVLGAKQFSMGKGRHGKF